MQKLVQYCVVNTVNQNTLSYKQKLYEIAYVFFVSVKMSQFVFYKGLELQVYW